MLDFDGVLHPEDVWRHPRFGIHLGPQGAGHGLFENADLLTELLLPYPKVCIVLSTSWVRQLSYSKTVQWLPATLRERVAGATFHSHMDKAAFASLPRGVQVFADVRRRQPREWLALDDDGDGWPPAHRERLVLTDPVWGVAEPAVTQRLVVELERRFGRKLALGA